MTEPFRCGSNMPDDVEYDSKEHHDAACEDCRNFSLMWSNVESAPFGE